MNDVAGFLSTSERSNHILSKSPAELSWECLNASHWLTLQTLFVLNISQPHHTSKAVRQVKLYPIVKCLLKGLEASPAENSNSIRLIRGHQAVGANQLLLLQMKWCKMCNVTGSKWIQVAVSSRNMPGQIQKRTHILMDLVFGFQSASPMTWLITAWCWMFVTTDWLPVSHQCPHPLSAGWLEPIIIGNRNNNLSAGMTVDRHNKSNEI